MIQYSDIERVGRLARLQLKSEEMEYYAQQIQTVLEHVRQLDQVDTTNVQPTTHILDETNAFREDVSEENFDQEEALANAPEQAEGYFKTPKILG